MKKAIVIVVVVAMFGWSLYEFVFSSDNTAEVEDEADDDDVTVGIEKGNKAPDFELDTVDDEEIQLSDYLGEPVMLNFWASWCGPCRSEMPDMQKLHEKEDIKILAVNLTETESSEKNVPDFMDELDLSFTVPLDEDNDVASLYQIQPVPTSFMIDSDGIIQNTAFGALNYEQMVQGFEAMD